jgi:hypothetical protein
MGKTNGGKMKNLVIMLSLALTTTGAFAAREELIIETVEVKNFSTELKGGVNVGGAGGAQGGGQGGLLHAKSGAGEVAGAAGGASTGGISFDQVGQVIAVAKDIVALGESIYTLVQHGKPSNTTEFTPISIVPKDPISKEIVSPFDMENCSFPVEKKFATTMKTGGAEVVKFEYMVIYTYGCSYNGTGKYIQNAIVQPVTVKTSYGWDFAATMKLSGIMNHGTKADPVVGAMLTIKYSMNSWRTAFERNDTVHITGKGELKSYSN